MRVIAGIRRGCKLQGFEGDAIRPTTDRVKENVFNLLAPYLAEAQVLDLFAGSGALAIEALSRGARSAVLCDNAKASVDLIRRNIQKTDFSGAATVVQMDAISYLKRCERNFDVILLDPPYNTGLLKRAMQTIVTYGVLSGSGILMAERDDTEPIDTVEGLRLLKERRYGRTHICLFELGRAQG